MQPFFLPDGERHARAGLGWGWNAGLTVDFSPTTRLGISYRSSIEYELDGDVTFTNRPAVPGAAAAVADSRANPQTAFFRARRTGRQSVRTQRCCTRIASRPTCPSKG
ncbi:MAG TPA: outer membrane protein transport protein [Burkholderiaceae bacterium]|nr:outer membrane protein transport protein [Burkholderiaceae bacterium]